jgi:hypothetical protein
MMSLASSRAAASRSLIRQVPAEVRAISFFTNLLLMASFFGLGVGCDGWLRILLQRLSAESAYAPFTAIAEVLDGDAAGAATASRAAPCEEEKDSRRSGHAIASVARAKRAFRFLRIQFQVKLATKVRQIQAPRMPIRYPSS